MRRFFAAAFMIAIADPAWATDGVIELNDTCAVNTGCFSGDTAGYPVTISKAGSYLLTSDLVIPNASTTGIQVSEPNVSIDLNGFRIILSACVGETLNCDNSGFGDGIAVSSPIIDDVSVHSGSIVGMGDSGIHLGIAGEVRDVFVRWNSGVGIVLNNDSAARNNRIEANGGAGISAGWGANISGNVISGNGGNGITAGRGALVGQNTTRSNGASGIVVNRGSTVRDNSSLGNTGDGINAGTGSLIHGNTAADNSNDGIEVLDGGNVVSNTTRENGAFGLRLGPDATYRENTNTANSIGQVNGGVNTGNNYCNGTGITTTACP